MIHGPTKVALRFGDSVVQLSADAVGFSPVSWAGGRKRHAAFVVGSVYRIV